MRPLSRRLAPVMGAAALLGVGYILGQLGSDPLAAQPAGKGVVPAAGTAPAGPAAVAGDKRVIAYIYGTTPITREEFGEYLIHQFGKGRVRLYVNRRIIEMAAAKRNIVVTPQEIDAIIDQDCGRLGMNKQQFIKVVLEQKYGKTIEEWREDVIKPRLILQAMCKGALKLEEEELKKVYENLYGEKVVCRIILWPKDQADQAFKRYDTIRKSDDAFDDVARNQLHSDLAARGGQVDPIGRHSGPGTAKIEEIAFKLKDGQLSEVIDTGAGTLVIKRVKSIPARTDVTYESVRELLIKELTDRLMEQEVPKMFARINEEAKPLFIMAPKDETRKELEDQSRRLGVDPTQFEKK
jgi:parvulin-like peptidyl-prolyl isomerase